MMPEAAIEFRGVWKGFHRHTGRLLLRSQVGNWISGRREVEKFYALKDLSFRMEHGESVAVVGANGAGKSTLLSLVAGLAPADAGAVAVNGQVAALLELGSGFHPDLTGAENVRLNAALLGIHRERMKEIYPAIVEFAEMGDFMDEPLRTYSAGMIMRLAFSVAVNVDPDILLIDEVLSVGDHAFQLKCFEKVFQFRQRGKTILCVSHVSSMVQQLCSRALWLDHGELMLDGSIAEVCGAYEGSSSVQG
ncbi:MAG TPA: ABC transporter ATP-binding protein [Bryobacteraceae bacterium]|nr:ABC transporter ATP-binding protein [Bryobacteraceae bacterium]